MNKTGVTYFIKGMNMDSNISIFQKDNYLYANNMRLSEGGNRMGALTNVQGNVSLGQLPYGPRISKFTYNSGLTLGSWAFDFNSYSALFTFNSENIQYPLDALVSFLDTYRTNFKINYWVEDNVLYYYSTDTTVYDTSATFACPNFNQASEIAYRKLFVLGATSIREDIYLICGYDTTVTPTDKYGYIIKLNYYSNIEGFNPSYSIVYVGQLELSTKYPVDIVSRFETETIQKLYWSDNYNALRCINVADTEACKLLPSELDMVTDVLLGRPYLVGISEGGELTTGRIQYAYQLYDFAGTETIFSPTSNMVNIYNDPIDDADSNQVYGSPFGTATGKAVTIKIENIDSTFKYIKVVSILHEKLNQDPTITIIADDIVPDSGTYEFTDAGQVNLGSVTIDEFNINGNQSFTAKTLASKDNYLLAGNITYKNFEVDFDARAYRFNQARLARVYNADGSYLEINGASPDYTSIPDTHDCINRFNSYNYDNDINYHYKYLADGQRMGAQGENITIVFQLAQMHLDNGGLPTLLKADKIIEDISTYAGVTVSNTSYRNYASPYIANYMTGYQRNEVYRLAIRFVNNKGQKTFPKWICDLRMPHIAEEDSITTFSMNGTNQRDFRFTWLYNSTTPMANILYLDFIINTSNLPSNVVGYEIMRVKRTSEDRTILGQGLMYNIPYDETSDVFREHMPTTVETSVAGDVKNDHLVGVISPDIIINHNLSYNSDDKIQVIGGYDAVYTGYTKKDNTFYSDTAKWTIVTSPNKINIDIVNNTTEKWYNSKWIVGTGDAKYIGPGEFETDQIYKPSGVKISHPFANYSDHNDIIATPDANSDGTFSNVTAGNYHIKSGTKILCTLDNLPRSTNALYNQANYYLVNYFRRRVSQYGGNSFVNRTRSEYIPISYNKVTSSSPVTIKVFNGDTFISYFDYVHLFPWDDGGNQLQGILFLPVETSFNLALREDNSFSRRVANADKYFYDESGLYVYNSVYSSDNFTDKAIAEQINQSEEDHYDCRILISELKTNGEEIDQWTQFKAANFYDVDTAFGPINKLIFFNNYIFAFQDKAFGVASINERALITDASVPTGLAIGTGDVLKRFDYLSQVSGTKHQWSVLATPSGIYWYDIINASVNIYAGKQASVSEAKGLKSYFYKLTELSNLYTKDNPHDYCGVNVCYDAMFGEINFSFKDYYPTGTLTLSGLDPLSYVCNSSTFVTQLNYSVGDTVHILNTDGERYDFVLGYNGSEYTLTSDQGYNPNGAIDWIAYRVYNTVSYNESFACWQSFYDFNSEIYWNHNGILFSVKRDDLDTPYIHKMGNYGEFYGQTFKSKLHLMLNDAYPYTKIYDSVIVDFRAKDGLTDIRDDFYNTLRCYNDRQITGYHDFIYKSTMATIPSATEVLYVRREDKFNFQIPKNIAIVGDINKFDVNNQDATRTFKDRMRDKYLVTELIYNNTNNYEVTTSLVMYNYRISIR